MIKNKGYNEYTLEELRSLDYFLKSPLSDETIVKCPKCGDEFIGDDVEDYNFCPICGAKMQKGGAK